MIAIRRKKPQPRSSESESEMVGEDEEYGSRNTSIRERDELGIRSIDTDSSAKKSKKRKLTSDQVDDRFNLDRISGSEHRSNTTDNTNSNTSSQDKKNERNKKRSRTFHQAKVMGVSYSDI